MKYLGKKSASSTLHVVLNVSWYLGLAATALLLLSQLYFLIFAPQTLSDPTMLQIETPGLVFRFTGGVTDPLSPTFFVLQFTLVLPLLAIGLFVIYQMRKIFATLVDENPFTVDNIRRIRLIGLAVIAGTILKAILHTLIGLFLSNRILLSGLDLNPNFRIDFTLIFLGVVIIILGEVFNRGARLQKTRT